MNLRSLEVAKLTITMEYVDGTTRTIALRRTETRPLGVDLNWDRPAIEVPSTPETQLWIVREPGPTVFVNLTAAGAPVED